MKDWEQLIPLEKAMVDSIITHDEMASHKKTRESYFSVYATTFTKCKSVWDTSKIGMLLVQSTLQII
jgi:hypothetical protein